MPKTEGSPPVELAVEGRAIKSRTRTGSISRALV